MKQPHLEKQRERWDTLIRRGREAGRNKDLKGASAYFDAAYGVSRSFPKKDQIRRQSAYFLGYAKFVENDRTRAAGLFQEFLDHPTIEEAEEKEVAGALTILGTIYYGIDNAKAAVFFERGLEIQRRLGLSTLESETMLGSIKILEHEYRQAITYYEPAYEKQKTRDPASAQQLTVQLAFAHRELGDTDGETKWQKANLNLRDLETAFTSERTVLKISPDMPDRWARDSLSHFLEVSRQNELATFTQRKSEYDVLKTLNERFIGNRKNLILTIMPIINKDFNDSDFKDIELKPEDWLEAYFYLRAHAAFNGAVRLALSAQMPEMYMLLRGCIENAIYAFYVWKKPETKIVWLSRNDNEASRQAVRDEFTITKIKKALGSVDADLRDGIMQMYDETIDQGAHPNVQAFIDNAVQKNENGALSLSISILNHELLDSALNNLAKAGELVLKVFKAMYPSIID